MSNSFKPINKQLMGLLNKYNLKEPFMEQEIKTKWAKILPKQLAAVTEPEKVNNGVLTVLVKNELWKNEIEQRKEELLKLIQSSVKGSAIKKINII